MKTFKLLSIITSLLLVFACSTTPSGSEYLGKWALKLKYAYWEMNITRVNESFLVEGTFNQDGIYTITKENNLVQSGIMGTTITYDKNTNTLIVSSGDDIDRWTRLQNEGESQSNRNQLAGKPDKSNNSIIQKIKRLLKKEIIDIDGNVYSTVKIGKQVWMVENLKTTKLNDGSAMVHLESSNQWSGSSIPGYCWNTWAKNIVSSGAVYNWYAVESGILCPKGWHVPSDDEWTTLIDYLGGEKVAGGKMQETGTTHWEDVRDGTTNESGFTAIADGRRNGQGWENHKLEAYWWSSTECGINVAWYRSIHYLFNSVWRDSSDEGDGLSVRCVRD